MRPDPKTTLKDLSESVTHFLQFLNFNFPLFSPPLGPPLRPLRVSHRQESAWQTTVGAKGSWVHAGGGLEAVGAPRGAIASTLHSSDELEEEGDVDPTCVGPGRSLATPPAQPGSITCPCRRCRAPGGCNGIALHGVLGGQSVQMQASSRTHMSINNSSRASRTRSPTGWRRTAQARSWTCMRKWHVYPAYWPM